MHLDENREHQTEPKKAEDDGQCLPNASASAFSSSKLPATRKENSSLPEELETLLDRPEPRAVRVGQIEMRNAVLARFAKSGKVGLNRCSSSDGEARSL